MLKTLASAAALAAFITAPALAETLKLAHWVPPAHVLTKSTIDPLIKGLADAGSSLEIQVYPGGELGAGPLEQYVRAVQGVADIVWGLEGYTSQQFPRTMIAELPGALPDGMHGYDMFWNAYDKYLTGEFPGTVPLALWLSEPNVFIMKDHDVHTPADVVGLKLRVSGSAAAAVVTALGATPVQMPAGEIYNALQTGLIDGVITGASAIGDFKLDEVANSYTMGAPLGRIAFYLVMNADKYNGLADADRAALDSVTRKVLSAHAEEGWNARADQVWQGLKETGDNTVIELTPEEVAAFGAITLPVRDQVIATVDGGADVLAAMQGK
ncbi:MAG: TRAP transporter substrate-binding protein [bacterium]